MNRSTKLLIAYLAVIAQIWGPYCQADVALGTLNISGNVPTVFSLSIRGVPGDLDLTPGVVVTDRLLAIVHFKYNVDMASLVLTSDKASGTPENATGAYPFGGVGFKYKFSGSCASVIAAGEANFTIAGAGSALANTVAGDKPSGLGYGIEEDCSLLASWGGAAVVAGRIPLADKYSETLTLTMTSI
jgi:hypothetical protein